MRQIELKNKIRTLIGDVKIEYCTACTYVQTLCDFDRSERCRKKALDRIVKSLHELIDYIEYQKENND